MGETLMPRAGKRVPRGIGFPVDVPDRTPVILNTFEHLPRNALCRVKADYLGRNADRIGWMGLCRF